MKNPHRVSFYFQSKLYSLKYILQLISNGLPVEFESMQQLKKWDQNKNVILLNKR